MPDSTVVADLPPGFPAYLGYADGDWPTAAGLAARFPAARRVILTVTGRTLRVDGIDVEPGNPSAFNAGHWAASKLADEPDSRPVIYASVVGQPGFGMGEVLRELAALGIARSEVRLLSAHYGAGGHICGPATCGEISVPMDGTQWTDQHPGLNGSRVDMSLLGDGFFGLTWTERLVQQLPVVRQGDRGEAVRTVQGLCVARVHGTGLVIDGIFGPATNGTVKAIQTHAGIPVDGVVGEQTWPVLLGIA